MSAENALCIDRMANGEYWVGVYCCGDTVVEAQGKTYNIAKFQSYEAAADAFRRFSDEDSVEYYYTEHGGKLPTKEELFSRPPHFLKSVVVVRYSRPCGCVDYRDLGKKKWRVVEYDADAPLAEERILGQQLWFAEAVTLANWHAQCQPGECRVDVPRLFRRFRRYDRHDCENDDWQLMLKRSKG